VNRVAVTPRSFRQVDGEHLDLLRASGPEVRFPSVDRPLTEPEMAQLVRGCWGLIVGVESVTSKVLDAGPLRVVVKYGAGTDNIDLDAARERRVHVEAVPGANARAVAELTITLLLALARHVLHHDRLVRSGSWDRRIGVELGGRLLGIVGYGSVGRQVAGLARALGMEVVAHDPFVTTSDVPLVDLPTLLSTSDAVTLHVPLTADTRGMIGARELARMRPGAFLVNTARGGIVDEGALAAALAEGRLVGAASDVFEREPPEGSPLLRLDNFVASPHAGAATVEAARRTGVAAVRALLGASATAGAGS
jgi:phosphoglycerate dehydrogenase-like enzyme